MQRHFLFVLAILVLAWLAGLPTGAWTVEPSGNYWPIRRVLIHGSGFLAIACMSLAMILAARPIRLEGMLGGLDQFYRLHKRLGIAGALFGVAHWLIEIVPRWMVGQGGLAAPQRRGAGAGDRRLFADWDELAATLGEWGLYLVLALVVVALWRRIPYRQFARLHRILPLAYLMLVFHSVVFLPRSYWMALSGPLAALLMAGGTIAAVLSLAGRIGARRRALGHVEAIRLHEDRVLEVRCQLETAWSGHESGQFVFVTFDRREGAHPFTVASAWRGDGQIVLGIKALGDYTRELPGQLTLGAPVTVEGPYGRFNFEGERERQVWVAGGIGIAPFVSRLDLLARDGAGGRQIDLFYSTAESDEALFARLRDTAARAGVRLHLVMTPRDPLLTPERLAEAVPDIAETEVWFCGPKAFGDALRTGLVKLGLPRRCFHQEAFEMR